MRCTLLLLALAAPLFDLDAMSVTAFGEAVEAEGYTVRVVEA